MDFEREWSSVKYEISNWHPLSAPFREPSTPVPSPVSSCFSRRTSHGAPSPSVSSSDRCSSPRTPDEDSSFAIQCVSKDDSSSIGDAPRSIVECSSLFRSNVGRCNAAQLPCQDIYDRILRCNHDGRREMPLLDQFSSDIQVNANAREEVDESCFRPEHDPPYPFIEALSLACSPSSSSFYSMGVGSFSASQSSSDYIQTSIEDESTLTGGSLTLDEQEDLPILASQKFELKSQTRQSRGSSLGNCRELSTVVPSDISSFHEPSQPFTSDLKHRDGSFDDVESDYHSSEEFVSCSPSLNIPSSPTWMGNDGNNHSKLLTCRQRMRIKARQLVNSSRRLRLSPGTTNDIDCPRLPHRKWICEEPFCERAFARPEHLKRHMNSVHAKCPKPNLCALAMHGGDETCTVNKHTNTRKPGNDWLKTRDPGVERSDNLYQHYITHLKKKEAKRNVTVEKEFLYFLIRKHNNKPESIISRIESACQRPSFPGFEKVDSDYQWNHPEFLEYLQGDGQMSSPAESSPFAGLSLPQTPQLRSRL